MSGPLPGWMVPISIPVSWFYGRLIERRNRQFDLGRRVQRVSRPVISIGNLTVGGTGKTPMTAWLVNQLIHRKQVPAIALRGYRGRPGAPSDESMEYQELCPQVDVVVDADRVAALKKFLPSSPRTTCIVLDDGFQHRFLYRDLDIVLIDALRPGLTDRLVPAGWLREPPRSLSRASAVIVTHADRVDPGLANQVASFHGREPIAWTQHSWGELVCVSKSEASWPVSWLDGRRVGVILGVGNPGSIRQQIERLGAVITADFGAVDHHHYSAGEIRKFIQTLGSVDAVLTTMKDWVKLRRLIDLPTCPLPILVPTLRIKFLKGEADLLKLVDSTVRQSSLSTN